MADKSPSAAVSVLTRDEYRDLYRRDYALFAPGADTGPGTQPFVDASLAADSTMVLFSDAVTLGEGTNLSDATGEYLLRWGRAEGAGEKLPPAGGSGYVTISASVGGTTLFAGDELKDAKNTGLRFAVSSTKLYLDGEAVPIGGIDTGAVSNLDAGTVLTFTSPRPGCGPFAIVAPTQSGEGLTGGRDAETDDQYRARIVARNADPPAAGNDAEVQQIVENLVGIDVQKAFTYPAILGPNTTGVAFTLRPAESGMSRAPNAAQILVARTVLEQELPADDSYFVAIVLEVSLAMSFRIAWSNLAGWANDPPWPPHEGGNVTVNPSPTPTALSCRVTSASPGPGGIEAPTVGQSLGFYDRAARAFVRKRIATIVEVTPGVSWSFTFDATNASSDATYVPIEDQRVSPWSDALDLVLAEALAYCDTLGPGEMTAGLFDPGYRRRRSPENPTAWPSTVTNKVLGPILDLPAVGNALLLEPVTPFETPVGTPGTEVRLFRLNDVAVYPF